jgi:hypothetical protein
VAEKFNLQIMGADEDVPRLLLAYGRACGGEMAFVMRPREDSAVLVHQITKQPARIWRGEEGMAPAQAPEQEIEPSAAVTEVKRMKASPPAAGPATLRGTWKGILYCTDGRPSMVLARKVASYGTLRLASGLDGRWTATFERAPRWFSKAAQESVQRDGLADAIQAGMGLVVGLVSEACSFRDTRRRNAVDAEYAAVHPYRPPREAKDPTERYKPKPGPAYRLRQDEAGFDVLDGSGNVVARFGAREKGKADKHLRALNKGQVPAVTVSADVADAFGLGGMPGVSVVPSLDALPTPAPPTGATSTARIAAATEKEAEALAELAQSSWGATDAPELLRRAGRLIKHAQALAASPLCTGKEQKAALEDIRRAAGAYQQAADALARGEKPDVVTTLRRISERVSIAAARAAKSCAAGQQKLGLERPTPGGESFPRGNNGATAPARTRKTKAPEVDPAKDKALVDAFAQAIQAAAAQMGAS